MTDLHCHILPNIDDGAKDVSISLRLLEKSMQTVCGTLLLRATSTVSGRLPMHSCKSVRPPMRH